MNRNSLKAIILAGGSGSRLWPLSRELYPKQLLKLAKDETLIQSTFLRLANIIDSQDILTVTNIKHFSDVRMQLEQVAEKNPPVISEPLSRNTAPAIAMGVKYFLAAISCEESDPVIIVLPSDHLIKNTDGFLDTVKKGVALAEEGYVVTFGIKPSCPETGYGYIDTVADSAVSAVVPTALKVTQFKEKPDYATAVKYIEQGNFFWNGGIFMFKASVFLEELGKYAPEIYGGISDCGCSPEDPTIPYRLYENMPNISIDYAIMEKSDKIVILPLESDWNDLGSWQSVFDVSARDENNNIIKGNVISKDCRNSLIYTGSKLIATVGLEDIILVDTEDAVLACNKEQAQDVKFIFDELKRTQNDLYLVHKTVFRPWGFYTVIERNEDYLIKTIQVQPRHKLSMQLHNHRSEHWVVLSGKAKVTLDGQEKNLVAGQSIDVPVKTKHSLQNPYDEVLKIIEIQRGDYISEDDIIRFEDIYGRV